MEQFKTNIFNIYNIINNEDSKKSFINTKIITKQYLAYYIYRIITKYIKIIELAATVLDINFIMSLYRIPEHHNRLLNYPMLGKMTNDNDALDMIILGGIDLFDKVNNYLNTLDTKNKQRKYQEFYKFLKEKKVEVIIKDIIDLQKLLPGLPVPIIRPNYLNDNNKL